MRLSEAASAMSALRCRYIKLNSRMTPDRAVAAPQQRGTQRCGCSDTHLTPFLPQSKRFDGDVDAYQEALDSARSAVLTTLSQERMRETYCAAFAPARERYTAVALKPKRTLLQRAMAVQTAASTAWAEASTTARGGAVLVAGAAGVLTVAIVYARWRWSRGS